MASKYCSDALVVGAGPAGLGVALGLARSGIKVVVLDLQDKLGSVRRGETIRYDKDMDALLGPGFFDKQVIRQISKRTYFSHSGKCRVNRTIKNPNNIINWPDFIQSMAAVVESAGVKIWTGSAVTGFIENNGAICGLKAIVSGFAEEELLAKAVFSCGGWDDPASRYLNIDRTHMDMHVHKQLVRDYTGPADRLEYHFNLDNGGGLTIGTIFPRSETEAEIILLNAVKGTGSPTSFAGFSEEHPLFKKRTEGVSPFYTLNTKIPMGGMLTSCSPKPGLVLAGDVMGHVQARGGSGITTSFLIGYKAGEIGAKAIPAGDWTRKTSEQFETQLRNSAHMRSLKKHNFIYSNLRTQIFGKIKTPEDMDKYWQFLKLALR